MYDVIIIGAGPSGSSCANNIKRFHPSASVLLIDKATFPRYKPCGGGISNEVKNYLDFDFSEAVSYYNRDVILKANQTTTQTQCDMILVRREQFDNFLVKKAADNGVTVLMNHEVTDIQHEKKHAIVKTNHGDFEGKIIVIAEGSLGRLARKLKIAPKNNVAPALEYEHESRMSQDILQVDFDYNQSGYAWVFPKSDGLSMGVGRFSKQKKENEASLQEQLKRYLADHGVHEIKRSQQHGHPVQLYSGKHNLVHGRIMLIGEIAGCVDPLTAEGIRPAIKSGFYAAKTIALALQKNKLSLLKKYNRDFHHHIGKDFRYARFAAYFLFRYFEKLLPQFSTPRAANAFVSVFNGEKQYSDYIGIKKILKIVKQTFSKRKTADIA